MAEAKTPSLQAEMLNVPKFVASGFNVSTSPTEVTILCTSLFPGITPSGEMVLGPKPEVVLSLSPQSAKELIVVLQGLMPGLEADLGVIDTPFLKERREKA